MGNVKSTLEEASTVNASEQQTLRHPLCRYVGFLTLFFGILTVIVLWACAVSSFGLLTAGLGVYLIIISIPVTLLELNWLINKCAFCSQEGTCCKIWRYLMWLDLWKRAIAYFLVSLPCYFIAISALGVISGIFLDILALLYAAKTFQFTAVSVYSANQQMPPPTIHDPATYRGIP